MVCPYPHGLRLSVISSLMYSTRYSDFIGYEIRDKHRIKNKIVEQDFVPLKAVNAKTKFVEAGKRKIAYKLSIKLFIYESGPNHEGDGRCFVYLN